jgi:predicted nucleotidyltransferase
LERTVEERWENNRRVLAFGNALRDANAARLGPLADSGRRAIMVDAVGIISHLLAHRVEFVVIGGQAMRAQGATYITEDLDVCYRRTPQNIAALAAAFAPLHPYMRGAPPGLPFTFDAPTIQAGLNFTLQTDLGEVDVLGEVSGLGNYERVYAQSDELAVFGSKVRILSLDGLIAAKKAAGRNKDRAHILELEELKKLREGGQG